MTRNQIEGGTSGGSETAGRRRPPAARLTPAVEQQINENLKLLYEQHFEQELPDQLKELVARLRGAESGK